MRFNAIMNKNVTALFIVVWTLILVLYSIYYTSDIQLKGPPLHLISPVEYKEICGLFSSYLKPNSGTDLFDQADSLNIQGLISKKFLGGAFIYRKGYICDYISKCTFPLIITCKKGLPLILLNRKKIENTSYIHVLRPGHMSYLLQERKLCEVAGECLWYPKEKKEERFTHYSVNGNNLDVNWVIKNIGVVKPGSNTITVILTNRGTEEVEIEKLHSACNCTFAANTEGTKIGPGVKHEVPITVKNGNKSGGFRQSIVLSLINAHTEKSFDVPLEIIGYCFGLEPMSTPSRIHFADVESDGDYKSTFRVSAPLPVDLGAVNISSSTSNIVSQLVRTEKTNSQIDYIIDVELNNTSMLTPGMVFNETVTLRTEHEIYSNIDVPVIIETQHAIKVEPSVVLWGMQFVGQEMTKKVTITGPPGDKIGIKRIDTLENMTIYIDETENENEVNLRIQQKFIQEGYLKGDIEVHFSRSDCKSLKIPAIAYIRKEVGINNRK